MTVFKMHQLGKNSACNKRRSFGYQVNDKKQDYYYKAVAVKKACKALIKGSSLEEIKEEMAKGFAEINYQTQQRELLLNDAYNQIKRYIDWEKRPLMDAVSTNVSLFDKMEVETTPDFIVADVKPVIEHYKDEDDGMMKERQIADGTIEIIKLKCSKPISQNAADEDLGLLAMLLYGRKFYKQGRLQIKASYYYLVRKDDSYGDRPSFKDFDAKQIVQISEVYEGKENETEEKYKPIVEDFVNGHDEQDCDEKDCKDCILYAICKGYTEAPVAIDREFKTKASDIRLNDLQKEAVEY